MTHLRGIGALLLVIVTSTSAAGALAQGDPKKEKKDTVPDGLKALKDPDPLVRMRAAEILGDLGPVSKFALKELHEALTDKDGRVRVKVADALWKIEKTSPDILLPVLTRALRDKDANVRVLVPSVMARMGSKAKPGLVDLYVALQDKEIFVRMEVILALGELGPVAVESIPLLFKLVGHKDFPVLEPMISVTLGSIGVKGVPDLSKGLTHTDAKVRRMAAYALGLIGVHARDAVPALAAALKDAETPVRIAVVEALGKIGQDARPASPKLRDALKDADGQVRVQAVLALWRVEGKAESLNVVREALQDK